MGPLRYSSRGLVRAASAARYWQVCRQRFVAQLVRGCSSGLGYAALHFCEHARPLPGAKQPSKQASDRLQVESASHAASSGQHAPTTHARHWLPAGAEQVTGGPASTTVTPQTPLKQGPLQHGRALSHACPSGAHEGGGGTMSPHVPLVQTPLQHWSKLMQGSKSTRHEPASSTMMGASS
jgi:hypothetical protein